MNFPPGSGRFTVIAGTVRGLLAWWFFSEKKKKKQEK